MRSTVVSVLAMAGAVSAHATMFGVWVNGEDQGDGRSEYIRSPPNNSPVKDLESPDIVCGPNGGDAVPSFVSAAAGDTLSFEWYHDNRNDDIIDGSHLGPIVTYIAEYTDGDGTGPIWTKIAEKGYDGSEWAVDKIKANNGLNNFELPAGLAAGQYLIRQEIIAHHESEVSFLDNPARGAQFYPSCVQVEVTSGGDAVPDQGFDFNTGYTYEDPGIVFNLYDESHDSYQIPGPEIWAGQSTGGNDDGADEDDSSSLFPPSTSTTSAPVVVPEPTEAPAPAPTSGADGDDNDLGPILSSTLLTVTTAPNTAPSAAPLPPSECRRRRRRSTKKSVDGKAKAKRAAKRGEKIVRRVGRAQL